MPHRISCIKNLQCSYFNYSSFPRGCLWFLSKAFLTLLPKNREGLKAYHYYDLFLIEQTVMKTTIIVTQNDGQNYTNTEIATKYYL